MNDENQISYYAVIPATIRYDERLKPAEKLLYGEITDLTNKLGYCYASNRYFANLYNVTLHTVSQWISHIEMLGYIKVELIRDNKKAIKERRVHIIDNPYVQKNTYPYVLKNTEPMYKKVQENNINIKIDRIFYYIINGDEKIPDELKDYDIRKIIDVLEKFEIHYSKEMLKIFSGDNLERIKIISCALIELTMMNKSLNGISRERLFVIYDKCKKSNTEIVSFYDYYLISVLNELYKP